MNSPIGHEVRDLESEDLSVRLRNNVEVHDMVFGTILEDELLCRLQVVGIESPIFLTGQPPVIIYRLLGVRDVEF